MHMYRCVSELKYVVQEEMTWSEAEGGIASGRTYQTTAMTQTAI